MNNLNSINVQWEDTFSKSGDKKSLKGSYCLNGKTYTIKIKYFEAEISQMFTLEKDQVERKIQRSIEKVFPLTKELVGKKVGISLSEPQMLYEKKRGLITPIEASNGAVAQFFSAFKKEMKSWVYIIQSSGGGGHIVAANALAAKHGAVKRLDIMRSFATFGSSAGTYFTSLWDEAQKNGDLMAQRKLVDQQPTADRIFYTTTFLQVAWDLLRSHETLPNEVIVTQPLQLPAIIDAVNFVNARRKQSGEEVRKIHLYMTDYPKPEAVHFFGALKRITQDQANKLVLHAPAPSKQDLIEGEDFWEKLTGKKLEVVAETLPVNKKYSDPSLPKPGDAALLTVEGQTFRIEEKDKVGLIVLGSQPTKEAVISSVNSMISLANRSKDKGCHRTLFVTCGKEKDNPLYQEVKRLKDKNKNESVTIVPMINQDIASIIGRADLTLNRTGGMLTTELLVLKTNPSRPDHKKVLIYTKTPSDLVAKAKRKGAKTKNEWQKRLQQVRNEEGNPLWEAGNARYLQEMCPDGEVEIVGTDEIDRHFREAFFPDLPPSKEKYPFEPVESIKENEIEKMMEDFELIEQDQVVVEEFSRLLNSRADESEFEKLLKAQAPSELR